MWVKCQRESDKDNLRPGPGGQKKTNGRAGIILNKQWEGSDIFQQKSDMIEDALGQDGLNGLCRGEKGKEEFVLHLLFNQCLLSTAVRCVACSMPSLSDGEFALCSLRQQWL